MFCLTVISGAVLVIIPAQLSLQVLKKVKRYYITKRFISNRKIIE